MSTVEEPAFVAETLAWCNERRAINGQESLDRLPLGRRYHPQSCPCGAATGLRVFQNQALNDYGEEVCEVPHAVGEFVFAFDTGKLPQYEAEEE